MKLRILLCTLSLILYQNIYCDRNAPYERGTGYKVTVINDDPDLRIRVDVKPLSLDVVCDPEGYQYKGIAEPKSTIEVFSPRDTFFLGTHPKCCIKEVVINPHERISYPGYRHMYITGFREKEYKDWIKSHPLPPSFIYKPKNGCANITLHVKEVNGKLEVKEK